MSLRVVLVSTYYTPIVGGVESNAARLATFLAGAGLDVRVVTKRVSHDLPDAETIDRVAVTRVGPYGNRTAAGKWRLAPAVFRWLLRHRASYDVVAVVDYRGVGLAALAARVITRRPVVLQGQTTGVLSGEHLAAAIRAVTTPVRALYRRADALACISRVLEREALDAGMPRDRVHFLPNAIDMERFAPAGAAQRADTRRRLDWPDDRFVVLFVGRLSREKGVMDLLEAWRLAQPSGALLAVAGPAMPGNPWDVATAAHDFIARHGLAGSVRLLGWRADVPQLLQAADLAVQPSHFEAQGLSAVEALACGVPVVATRVGGLAEFVRDGHNGILCPPQDPAALAAALRALMGDPAKLRALAAHARPSVAAEYDERIVFGRFAALLESVTRGESRS